MGDLLSGFSAPGASSYIPLSGFSRDDARLAAENPEQNFAGLLKAAGEKTEEGGAGSKKPLIDKTDKLYEQCQALETFLVKTLLSTMRNTVQKSGLVDQGFAGEMYEDMLYDEYAKDLTKNAGFGFADLAYLELTGQRGKVISRYA